MDNVIKQITGFVGGLGAVLMAVLPVTILWYVLTGGSVFGMDVVANLTALITSLGNGGFVGLVVPHMMRVIVGPDHRVLIPASALGGAIFLLIADALARTLLPPLEIPVGALTALVGSPYFIYLLRKKRNTGEF